MSKKIFHFLSALLFSSCLSVYGQSLEQSHTTTSTGDKIASSSDRENFAIYGNGKVDLYFWDNNNDLILEHSITAPTYEKRQIAISENEGADYTFYKLSLKGQLKIVQTDFETYDLTFDNAIDKEVWVTKNTGGSYYFYGEINSDGTISQSIIELNSKIDEFITPTTLWFGAHELLTPDFTGFPVSEVDTDIFASAVHFQSNFQVYISDPAYNGHEGRVIQYEKSNGVWAEKTANEIRNTSAEYGTEVGKSITNATSSWSSSILFSSNNFIFDLEQYNSDPSSYHNTGNIAETSKFYSAFFESEDGFSTFEVKENGDSKDVEFYFLLGGDGTYKNNTITTGYSFDEIFDVFHVNDPANQNPDQKHIIIAGVRSGKELIDIYQTNTDHSIFTLINTIDLGSASASSNISISEYNIDGNNNYYFSILNRSTQNIKIFDTSYTEVTSTPFIASEVEPLALGSDFVSLDNSFLVASGGENFIIYRLPYYTIEGADFWRSNSSWLNNNSPDSDKNASVVVQDYLEIDLPVDVDKLYISGGIQVNLTSSNIEGIIYANINANKIINIGTLNSTGNNTISTTDSLYNEGILNILSNSQIYCENVLKNKGFFNVSDSDVEILKYISNDGVINQSNATFIFNNSINNITCESSTNIIFNNVVFTGNGGNSYHFSNELKIDNSVSFENSFTDLGSSTLTLGAMSSNNVTIIGSSSNGINFSVDNLNIKGQTTLNNTFNDGNVINVKKTLSLNNTLDFQDIYYELYIGDANIGKGDLQHNDSGIFKGSYYYVIFYIEPDLVGPTSLRLPVSMSDNYSADETNKKTSIQLDISNVISNGYTGTIRMSPRSHSPGIRTIGENKFGIFKDVMWNVYIQDIDDMDVDISINTDEITSYPIATETTNIIIYDDYDGSLSAHNIALTSNIASTTSSINFKFPNESSNESPNFTIELASSELNRTFTSVSDGDWYNPYTWDLIEVPSSEFDSVVVYHNIDLLAPEGEGEFQPSFKMPFYGALVLDAINIAAIEGGETSLYGNLFIEGNEMNPNFVFCDKLNVDTNCNLNLDFNANLTIGNNASVNEFPGDGEDGGIIPKSIEPVGEITVNGDISLATGGLNLYKNLELNGAIGETTNSYFGFYGDSIFGTGNISISTFEINEIIVNDERTVQINTPIHIKDYIDSQGVLNIEFNNTFTIDPNATIESMGLVSFFGDPNNANDQLDLYTNPFHESVNFVRLRIEDYNVVNFHSNTSVGLTFEISNADSVNMYQADLVVNPYSDVFTSEVPIDIFSFNNVQNFINIGDGPSNLEIYWKPENNHNTPVFNATHFENFNSYADSIYLVKPSFNDLSGSFNLLAQTPTLDHRSKQLYDNSFVKTDIIQANDEYIYFTFEVNNLDNSTRTTLHEDENLNIYYNTSFIGNAIPMSIPLSNDSTQSVYAIAKNDLSLFNFDIYQNITLEISIGYKNDANNESNVSSIDFVNIPSGYVHEIDRPNLVNFFKSLGFKDSDFTTEFIWSFSDLDSWESTGAIASLDSLENIISINGEGRITEINIENKNITSLDFNTLKPAILVDGQAIVQNESETNIINIEMEYLSDLLIDNNYINFDELAQYDNGNFNFNLDYSIPAIPFDTFNHNHKRGEASNLFTFSVAYSYDLIEWINFTDSQNPIFEENSTNTFDVSSLSSGSYTYKIITSMNEGNFSNLNAPQIEYELSIEIEAGEAEKQELFDFLTELGGFNDITMADNMRDWASIEMIAINDLGYVDSINVSNRNLSSLPSNISNFSGLLSLDVSGNNLFYDDLDELNNIELASFTFGNQSYAHTPQSVKIHHGEAFTTTEDFTFYTNENSLSYTWVLNDSDVSDPNQIIGDQFTIPDIDNTFDGDKLELKLSHTDYLNLDIKVAEYNFMYALGRQDSLALKQLLQELNITVDPNTEMRDWTRADGKLIATDIDASGFALSLNLSNLNLENLPSNIGDFDFLQQVDLSNNNFTDLVLTSYSNSINEMIQFDVSNNYLFFDDIYNNTDFISNYDNQVYSHTIDSTTVSHGDSYSKDGTLEGFSLNYQWIKTDIGNTVNTTGILAIDSMTQADEGNYTLITQDELVPNLSIQIDEISLSYKIGDKDSLALKQLLQELNITVDPNTEMRDWTRADGQLIATDIDASGFVLSLNLSNLNLENLPSNISDLSFLQQIDLSNNNFTDLTLTSYSNSLNEMIQFDVSNNYLFFDDIYNNIDFISNYDNQVYSHTIDSTTVSHGDSYSKDGTLEGFSLNYQWINDIGNTVNTTGILAIDSMTQADEGNYTLITQDELVPNLSIQIDEINLIYKQGEEDSLLLHQVLSEIGHTDYNPTTEFRAWLGNRAQIDNYGRVIELDLSAFLINDEEGNYLSTLPTSLLSFNYLEGLQIENNTLNFSELENINTLEGITSYFPQNSTPFIQNIFVNQYEDYSSSFNVDPANSYSWVFNGDTTQTSNDAYLEVNSFDISKEGTYYLIANSSSDYWNDLDLRIGEVTLSYLSLISEEDSLALHQLFTTMNVEFDDNDRIIDWPRMEYNINGHITSIFLHELNGVNTLPDIIGQFDELETLKLYNSSLDNLSDSLWTLVSLEYLDLSGNNLESSELTNINNLTLLRTLWLSQNKLTSIPKIDNLSDLRYLILDENDITTIGTSFNNLTNLLDLSIAGNNLESITTDFSVLSSLKKLDFSRNNLSEWSYNLPESIEELILYSNNISSLSNIPKDIIVNIADNLLFFDDLSGYLIDYINYSPQRYNIQYENIAMIQGESYSYTLPFEDESIKYIWFKDGVIMNNIIGNTITIEDMTNDDSGVYTCFVSHNYWSDLSIQTLQITIGLDCGTSFSVDLRSNSNEWVCYGEDINVELEAYSNNENLTYIWYKGDELLSLLNTSIVSVHEEGLYSVKVQNSNGCITISDSIEITVAEPLITPNIMNLSDSLTVDHIDENLQYFWYINGELSENSNPTIAKIESGVYHVEVMNTSGCSITSSPYNVSPSDIITDLEVELAENIVFYPQPANQILNIKIDQFVQIENIRFLDINGKSIKAAINKNASVYTINTNHLKNGLYIMELTHIDNRVSYNKVMITH